MSFPSATLGMTETKDSSTLGTRKSTQEQLIGHTLDGIKISISSTVTEFISEYALHEKFMHIVEFTAQMYKIRYSINKLKMGSIFLSDQPKF